MPRLGLGFGLEYRSGKTLNQLLKQAGCVLALSASKADGTKPRTGAQSPWVDLTPNANNATLNNVAGTASDGWVNQWMPCESGQDVNVVNLLGNDGNFALGINPFITFNANKSQVSNEIKVMPTATNSEHYIDRDLSNVGALRQMYAFGYIRSTVGKCRLSIFNKKADGSYDEQVSPNVSASTSTFASVAMTTPSIHATPNFKVRVQLLSSSDARSFLGSTEESYAMNLHLLDLTQIFGAGKEPSQVEMDRIMTYAIAKYGYVNTQIIKMAQRALFKADGLDTFGSMTNSASMDITGTQNFAFAGVFVTPSVLQAGYVICKNTDAIANMQYSILVALAGNVDLYINGAGIVVCPVGSILANTKYDLKIVREAGRLKCWLNGVLTYDQPNTTNITPSQPNLRLFARSSNAGGTTHAAYSNNYHATLAVFKGALCTKVNIDKAMQALNRPYL